MKTEKQFYREIVVVNEGQYKPRPGEINERDSGECGRCEDILYYIIGGTDISRF